MERGLLDGGHWQTAAPLSLEEDILRDALAGGKRLFGLECSGRFIDIGVPEDYARASTVLTGGR